MENLDKGIPKFKLKRVSLKQVEKAMQKMAKVRV